MNQKLALDTLHKMEADLNTMLAQVGIIKNYLKGSSQASDKIDVDYMLEEVYEVVNKIPGFDHSFLDSINYYWEKNKSLSPKQRQALINLHEKFCG